MQINLRFSGSATLLAVALLVLMWWLLDGYRPRMAATSETRVVAPEVPVVMRTTGGLLEVATVKATERFTRADTKEFWGIPLGTTVSQIQVPVIYRYHIQMAREWPLTVRDKTCIVQAGALEPSLPVAFDSALMEKYSRSGWARFDKDQNLATLERSLTPELQLRARSNQYRQLATEAARETVAEFVTTWLLKEQAWARDAQHKVVVVFPGEAMPPRPAATRPAEARQ
jgi:hypothetical protein